jgi:exopolysaccharide biosynthesis protein
MLTTTGSMKIDDVGDIFATLGCKTAFNLDGGGSTSLFIKNPGATTATKIVCSDGSTHTACRSIIEGIYFVEK